MYPYHACIVHVSCIMYLSCMYFDVSHQDTSRYNKKHLYLSLWLSYLGICILLYVPSVSISRLFFISLLISARGGWVGRVGIGV